MSDRPEHSSESTHQPLFQQADEQERIYAPEQVPDALPGAENNDPDTHAAVPPAPTTSITTPELTMAAPASIATEKEAADTTDNRDDA